MSTGRVLWTLIVLFVLALAVSAVVTIVNANSGGAETGPGGSIVQLKNVAFAPTTMVVKKGDYVEFTNADAVPHTVTADDKSVDSGVLGPGKTFKVDVSKSFAYHCEIHPSMKAKIELAG